MPLRPLRLVTALLLTISLIASTAALASVRCVCIPIPAKAEAAGPICPISKKAGCHCCGPVKKQTQKASKRCQFTVSTRHSQAGLPGNISIPHVAALPALVLDLSPLATETELPARPHLILPRIRTPDVGPPGLRAPPTR